MVEHDMDLVMGVCDEIHVLDFGSIIATGTPAEIRENSAVQKAYLGEGGDEDDEPVPAYAGAPSDETLTDLPAVEQTTQLPAQGTHGGQS